MGVRSSFRSLPTKKGKAAGSEWGEVFAAGLGAAGPAQGVSGPHSDRCMKSTRQWRMHGETVL